MYTIIKKIIFLIITVVIYIISAPTFAQNSVKVDSLILSIGSDVYENPSNAIAIGNSIYQNKKNRTKDKIRGLIIMVDGYTSKRDYQKSLAYALRANELSIPLNDNLLRIKVLFKLATQFQQLKIYDEAIAYLDQSEEMILQFPVRDSVQFLLGSNYVIRGFIYKEQLNCDIAVSFFDKGIQEYKKLKNFMSNPNLSITYYNEGNCYILMNQNEEAKNSFTASIAIARQINAKSLEAFSQKGLAEVLTLEGKYPEAIQLLQDALVNAKAVGDLVLNQGIYKGLSENYLACNEWEKYRIYHLQYLRTKLDLRESQRKSISDSLIDSATNQSLILKNFIRNYYYLTVSLLILTLVLVLFFIFLYLKIQKDNLKLKDSIQDLQNIK